MPTVAELVQSVAGRLEAAGIAESRLEARLLLADAAGWTLEKIIAERDAALESGVVARVERLAARRQARSGHPAATRAPPGDRPLPIDPRQPCP